MNSGLVFVQNKMVLTPNGALLSKHYDMIWPEYFAFGHESSAGHHFYIFGSHDGLTWIELPVPDGDNWSGFLCVRNLYVGWAYNRLAVSPNAVDWEIINPRETSLGTTASIQSVSARVLQRDFLITYKQSSSGPLQAVLTTDFRTFTTIPAPDSSAYVYSAGNYYFYSYEYNGSSYFGYFNDTTGRWTSFRSNIPDVFPSASYSLNEWRANGKAVKFDGQHYRIFGRGSAGAWSPIYRSYRAIQSCTQDPTQQWTSTGYGDSADTVVTWTGGAYSLYGKGNITTPRTIYKFNGANADKYTLSSSGSPRYEIFDPVGDHTYCWQYGYIDTHRIVNSTLYEVVFPRTFTECYSLSCIKLPVYH